jgi:hypothetical protein
MGRTFQAGLMGTHAMSKKKLGHGTALACLLLGGVWPLCGRAPAEAKAKEVQTQAPRLVEAFLKGPVGIEAKVIRGQGKPEEAALPLFQVPVLEYQDLLELSFSGEAFDQRVTDADWSLIVVFLPKTVAPTDQGVVSLRLKHKAGRMVVPAIRVPYDSIPMIFLIPDKNGRKKVLKDLNTHLEAFRSLCAKIADMTAERATVDKFIENLDAIDKTMSPVQYDNAVLGFLHTYGTGISVDVQAFSANGSTNLDKCQFLTQEFRTTNVLVPDPAAPAPAAALTATVTAGAPPISAYVSIFFDVATIISNLWPGHQFQYLPALARNFHDDSAELYYTDWIHTTGDTLGALMCCPGKWEDQSAPAFALELPAGESLLRKQTLFKADPKDKNRGLFSLFGHDWKMLVTGPKGETLPPLTLTISPNKASFVALPAPLLEPIRKLGAAKVKVRVIGRWGFTSIATDPLEVPVGCDPAWAPEAKDKAAFQIGNACGIKLPAAWASVVDKVLFRPAAKGAEPLIAKVSAAGEGAREAVFRPGSGDAGAGTLEITLSGSSKPALVLPLTLLEAVPEASSLEARLGEEEVFLKGHHLKGVKAVALGGRTYLPGHLEAGTSETLTLKAEDGKPLEGALGRKLETFLVVADGPRIHLEGVSLVAARPRLREAEVVPVAGKGSGLALTSVLPVAPTSAPSLMSLLAGKGYRFPSDGAFHIALRNAEEPTEIRQVPASKIRVVGNNQKAMFTVLPADLLGGRASGKLEAQVEDDHAGASVWLPLPATFLDLPVIAAVQGAAAGVRLIGPALDSIEAVAAAPGGPWEKVSVIVEEGHETMNLVTPLSGGRCYLRVFGWPELVLALNFPPIVPPVLKTAAPDLAAEAQND